MKLEILWTKMCMNFPNRTETDCCLYLDLSPKEGSWPPVSKSQWSHNGDSEDGEDHLLVPELRLLGPAVGGGGLGQAGGRGSSENSVYVAFLKSRRSFTGLGEHHWWKYMHWGQMFERLTKSNQSRRIVFLSSRQECVSSSEDDQETHVVWIGGEALSQERCLLASIWQEDCNLPQVGAHIHSAYFFDAHFPLFKYTRMLERALCSSFSLFFLGLFFLVMFSRNTTRANFSFSWMNNTFLLFFSFGALIW